MYRKAIEYLKKWKSSPYRSPLLLRGARQVGKTWIVRDFGKEIANFFEINLEESPEYLDLFVREKGNPQKILDTIITVSGKTLKDGPILLFIDEIQECPDALISLRYFKEKCPEIYVIAAGSLVEFALKEISFPVGRIDYYHIFPFDFEEFLLARGKFNLVEILNQKKMESLEILVHQQLINEFKIYTAIGGLPEVINAYMSTNDLEIVQSIQQKLIVSYRNDFNKYASHAEIKYVKAVFDSIPLQLGQKFMFSRVAPETKSRDLHTGLNLLVDAGLAYKCYHSSGNQVPLNSEIKENKFKVFFFDTGLIQRLLGRSLKTLLGGLESEMEFAQQGNICESIVAQQIVSQTKQNESPALYYWLREAKSSKAEVDFLIPIEDKVLPAEVKRGSRESFKSLKIFMEEKNKKIGIVISAHPFEVKGENIYKIPFYGIHQIFSLVLNR